MDALRTLLQNATEKERNNLQVILAATLSDADSLIGALQWNANHLVSYGLGGRTSYREVVKQVARAHKVTFKEYDSVEEIEHAIVLYLLEQLLQHMTPEQREGLEEAWRQEAQTFDKTSSFAGTSASVAAMLFARSTGFGVYLAASTLVGALTSAAGITLPFVAYTTMSSAIALVLGPVGWASMGVFAVWKLGSPNTRRLTSAVLQIAAIRNRGSYHPPR